MSLAASLLLARAVTTGTTQRRRLLRHVHLTDAPLLATVTLLAGEPAGVLAIAASRAGQEPQIWTVPEPRDRSLRDAALEAFYSWLIGQVAQDRAANVVTQLVVPSPAEADALRQLARLHRYQRRSPPLYPETVVAGAQLLTVLTERRDVPGSALCLDATSQLLRIFVPPLSPPECAHLGALVAAIDPPVGRHAADAAHDAETVSMGLIPDPAFDNNVLGPAIEAFNTARKNPAADRFTRARPAGELDRLGRSLVGPKLEVLDRAVGLLAAIPEAPSAADRFHGTDIDDWTLPADAEKLAWRLQLLDSGQARFALRPSHSQQARWAAQAEAIQQVMHAREIYEDRLAFAEAVGQGAAWAGTIVSRDDRHTTVPAGGKKKVSRPRITAESALPLLISPGNRLRWADDPAHVDLEVVDATDLPDGGTQLVAQVVKGMRRWREAPPTGELRLAEASPQAPPMPPGVDPACWKGLVDA